MLPRATRANKPNRMRVDAELCGQSDVQTSPGSSGIPFDAQGNDGGFGEGGKVARFTTWRSDVNEPTFPDGVLRVVECGSGEQMNGAKARRGIACVADSLSFWDRPNKRFVGQTVRIEKHPVNANQTVVRLGVTTTVPQPTGVVPVSDQDVRHENVGKISACYHRFVNLLKRLAVPRAFIAPRGVLLSAL